VAADEDLVQKPTVILMLDQLLSVAVSCGNTVTEQAIPPQRGTNR